MLEERLSPAVSPLEMSHAATAAGGRGRAGADPAVVAWLNDVAGVVLNTSIRPAFVSQLAQHVARGLSLNAATYRLLATPDARLAITQQSFQHLLGRGVTPGDLNAPRSAWLRAGRPAQVLPRLTASSEYYQRAGGTDAGFRTALGRDLLGGRALPAALAGLPVQPAAQRLRLVGRLLRTPIFAQAWTARLAGMALSQGQFPAALLQAAARQLRQPDGFRLVLARFLGHAPVAARRPASRPTPVPPPMAKSLTVGPTLPTYFDVSRQGLVPDPVTDPPAYNQGNPATATSYGVPMNSPWRNAAVFPEVPYASIMAGGAAQPTLQLSQSPVRWPTTGHRASRADKAA